MAHPVGPSAEARQASLGVTLSRTLASLPQDKVRVQTFSDQGGGKDKGRQPVGNNAKPRAALMSCHLWKFGPRSAKIIDDCRIWRDARCKKSSPNTVGWRTLRVCHVQHKGCPQAFFQVFDLDGTSAGWLTDCMSRPARPKWPLILQTAQH